MTVSAISSAIEKIAFLNSSKPIGSMSLLSCIKIGAPDVPKRRVTADMVYRRSCSV